MRRGAVVVWEISMRSGAPVANPRALFVSASIVFDLPLVVSKGWKPGVAPPIQRSTVNLSHCLHSALVL